MLGSRVPHRRPTPNRADAGATAITDGKTRMFHDEVKHRPLFGETYPRKTGALHRSHIADCKHTPRPTSPNQHVSFTSTPPSIGLGLLAERSRASP